MIIFRQKQYATGVERVMAKAALDKVGKKKVPKLSLLSPKQKAAIKKVIDDSENTVRDYYKNLGFIW